MKALQTFLLTLESHLLSIFYKRKPNLELSSVCLFCWICLTNQNKKNKLRNNMRCIQVSFLFTDIKGKSTLLGRINFHIYLTILTSVMFCLLEDRNKKCYTLLFYSVLFTQVCFFRFKKKEQKSKLSAFTSCTIGFTLSFVKFVQKEIYFAASTSKWIEGESGTKQWIRSMTLLQRVPGSTPGNSQTDCAQTVRCYPNWNYRLQGLAAMCSKSGFLQELNHAGILCARVQIYLPFSGGNI